MKNQKNQVKKDKLQITSSAAKVYEDFFVPAIFKNWADKVVKAANIKDSDIVLDVACGTGILARTIAQRIGPEGKVMGIDINNEMLQVAAKISPGIKWILGPAESLPLEDNEGNVVVSQFALMFFSDRPKALQEMMRVLKPRGHLTVAVWDSVENSPGYEALVNLLQRLFGNDVAEQLRLPFVLGDRPELINLFKEAGISDPTITTLQGKARFPSIRSWVHTDVKGWTMSEMINDQQFDFLLNEADKDLSSFLKSDGTVSFDMPAHIVYANKM